MTSSPSQGDFPSRHIKAILFTGMLLGGAWFVSHHVGNAQAQTFVVAHGASAHEIALELKRQDLIRHPWTFLFWVKVYGHAGGIKPGVYILNPRDGARTIYKKLRQGPPRMRVTLPEGWTSKQMAAHLEAQGVTHANEFLKDVSQKNLEGFLFPDTYFFEQELRASQVTALMVRRFHEEEPRDMAAQAKALHLTYRQIVTLASIVEREARAPQERALIAGVFYNRLRKKMRLESCATVEYALGAWKPQLTYKDLEVNSPYNTYRHAGLPPGPICNPGAASLQAAAHPAVTDMMFFVADSTGTHRFSRDYDKHLAVQKIRRRASSEKQTAK